jgi:palmitoyltransferase ZDHHC9/14/18
LINLIIHSAIWILTNISLLKTAFTDPGIIPRQINMEPHFQSQQDSCIPTFKHFLILTGNGSQITELKFCETCMIYRPPGCSHPGKRAFPARHRTVHCTLCDSCMLDFDHHCPWLSNCIAKHNYVSFLLFIHL